MYNSSIGYKIIKKEIGELMLVKGFASHKTVTYYRVTAGHILQYINFQKGERSLNEQMTINLVVQPLFSPGCSFQILCPGGRVANLTSTNTSFGWYCNTEEATLQNIQHITTDINNYVIPFFNNLSTAEQLCYSFDDPALQFIWSIPANFVSRGYSCLKAGQYKQALSIFEANRPGEVPKYKTIKRLIEELQFEEINAILNENIRFHKEKLKI
ncbi:MAG: hypothetical protein JWQ57_4590 [Mucilaginibacter sp.]|nr:hypothetical protein [Mucilaginibacter sp.]